MVVLRPWMMSRWSPPVGLGSFLCVWLFGGLFFFLVVGLGVSWWGGEVGLFWVGFLFSCLLGGGRFLLFVMLVELLLFNFFFFFFYFFKVLRYRGLVWRLLWFPSLTVSPTLT